jgi:predicted MFS family arabinose efflux permease
VLLTLRAGRARAPDAARLAAARSASPWRDLREGLAYVWNTPLLLAVMLLAFMLNVTAFPQITGLMPYVAKEVYHADQKTLGYLLASFSSGALIGSITLSRYGSVLPPARSMVLFATGWYVMLMVFAHTQQIAVGMPVLVLTGFCHSMGQIPMAATLLRNSDEKYRGRIMGIRMMAIYGNLPGLWIAAPLIKDFGYTFTATLYCVIGLASIVLVTARWRAQFWRLTAPANRR